MKVEGLERVLVIPPMDSKDAVERSQERLLWHLSEQFPEFEFALALDAPFEVDDEYVVIPLFVEGRAVPGGILNAFPTDTRAEIERACSDFNFGEVH